MDLCPHSHTDDEWFAKVRLRSQRKMSRTLVHKKNVGIHINIQGYYFWCFRTGTFSTVILASFQLEPCISMTRILKNHTVLLKLTPRANLRTCYSAASWPGDCKVRQAECRVRLSAKLGVLILSDRGCLVFQGPELQLTPCTQELSRLSCLDISTTRISAGYKPFSTASGHCFSKLLKKAHRPRSIARWTRSWPIRQGSTIGKVLKKISEIFALA